MGKIFWIVVVFLLVGAYMIKMNSNLNLSESEDQKSFVKTFFSWVGGVGKNTANVVGYATKQDWLPNKSETNSSTEVKQYLVD